MSIYVKDGGFRLEENDFTSGLFFPFVQLQTSRSEDASPVVVSGTPEQTAVTADKTFWGDGQRRSFRVQDAPHRIDYAVTVTAAQAGHTAVILDMTYTNTGDRPIWLKACGFRCAGPAITVKGNPADWFVGGIVEDTRVHPLADYENSTELQSYSDYFTLYTNDGLTGLCCAPVGVPAAFLQFSFCGQRAGALYDVTCSSDMSYVRVAPGQTRAAQSMALCVGPYDECLHDLFVHMAETHGCRKSPPLVGWCSWYYYFTQVTAQNVRDIIGAANKENGFALDVIQIDDGFQTAPGDWTPNEKFPGGMAGMAALATDIRACGARPGIWLAPAIVHESTQTAKAHPDWLLRHTDGTPYHTNGNWGGTSCGLDFSHPGAYAFAMDTVKAYRDAGFTYFKIDFNEIVADGRCAYDDSRTSLELYRDVYRGYRREIGEECYLNACAGFSRGAFGFADACRVGPDSVDVWEGYCSIARCLRSVGKNAVIRDTTFALDPDVTYLHTRVITPAEYHTWHSFVGLLGGLTFISDPIDHPEYQKDVRQFEILNPPVTEKGLCLHPGVDPWNRRFGFTANRPWGDFAVAMLYNPEDAAATLNTAFYPFEKIGTRFHVWSFWTGEYLGIRGVDFPMTPEAHDVALLRLTPVTDKNIPTVIGTDLHIGMGAAEITDVTADKKQMVITLRPDAGAREGRIFIYANDPGTYRTEAIGCKAEGQFVSENVLCIHVSERETAGKQTVSLTFIGQ